VRRLRNSIRLASKRQYQRIWFKQTLQPEKAAFDPNDFLLKKGTAEKRTAPARLVTSPREQPPEDYALLLWKGESSKRDCVSL
jgi:hypothetical protein